MPRLLAICLFTALATPVHAQTIDDGVMLPKYTLFTGEVYARESWDEYWEGPLKRDNGNIGTLTTQTSVWSANYGVHDRLNVIAEIPYVWTRASQGVLRGMKGFQDVTLAGKYLVVDEPTTYGALRAFAVVSGVFPMTDYTPDFQPLSIGSASRRAAVRGTLHFHATPGWFVNGSAAYTWREKVTLDRPYYFTNDEFILSDEVDMPDVVDYTVSGGYMKGALMTAVSVSQQHTQGGGDIRRQDMPFVSNRMNATRVGAMAMVPIPKLRRLVFQAGYAYTVEGRNVGQATRITTGLLYRFNFNGSAVK